MIMGYAMFQFITFYQEKQLKEKDQGSFFLPQFKSLIIGLYIGILIQFPDKFLFAQGILKKANADLSQEDTMGIILFLFEYVVAPFQIYEETMSTVQLV